MLLQDKTALITGGASGMGRAAARLFSEHGAHVVVVDQDAEAATATVKEIETAGGSATDVAVDVRDLSALKTLADDVSSSHGKLDVLFNNVGVPGAAGLDLSEEEWNLGLEINARASFYLCNYFEDALRASGNASVVFTSSTSGLVGSPYSPMYSFTKGGVVALVRSLALAWADAGVRVNAIAPGTVETPGLSSFFRIDDQEEIQRRKEAFVQTIPLQRAAQPEEIANVALFLASGMSSFITGVTVPVDGGMTAK